MALESCIYMCVLVCVCVCVCVCVEVSGRLTALDLHVGEAWVALTPVYRGREAWVALENYTYM